MDHEFIIQIFKPYYSIIFDISKDSINRLVSILAKSAYDTDFLDKLMSPIK